MLAFDAAPSHVERRMQWSDLKVTVYSMRYLFPQCRTQTTVRKNDDVNGLLGVPSTNEFNAETIAARWNP